MNLFCLLWMPLFYLFWRSIAVKNIPAGGVWALILGSVVAIFKFFLGGLYEPGGFGHSRWLSGFIDIVTLPALAPILVYLFLIGFKKITRTADFANFALLWLIPDATIRALSWSSERGGPIHLVLVPILWTAIAVGISFFIRIIQRSRWFIIIPAFLGILIIPFAATNSYWAFFSQQTSLGFLFLLATAAPMLVYVLLSYFKA